MPMPAHIDPEDPSLSAAELDRVEDDLDQILEESPWPSGEKYLAPSLVCASLHQRGHSPESIKAALNRLRAAKVFDVRHYPPGVMVDPEPNKYYTTRQRWSAYLAARRAAPAVRPAAALAYDPTRDQPGTLAEWNRHALVTETCWRGGMYSRIPVQLQPAPGSGLA